MKNRMMQGGWRNVVGLLLCLGLCGCYDVKDELVIRADGSGEVRVETVKFEKDSLRDIAAMAFSQFGASGPMFVYPPTDRGEGKKFFAGKGFTVTEEWKREDQGHRLIVKAQFKDIRTLLESPYAQQRGISILVTNGELVFRATSGFQPQSRLMEMNADDFKGRNNPYWAIMKPKVKEVTELLNRLRGEFSVQLPKPGESKKTGVKKVGEKVSWTISRGEWTNLVQFAEAAAEVVEVRCPADGIAWTGTEVPPLNVMSFSELPTGVLKMPDRTPELDVVKSQARFEPYALEVVRTVNLTGEEEHFGQAGGVLVGGVEVSEELMPDRWGPVKLKTAKDATGKNLIPEDDRFGGEEFDMGSRFGWERMMTAMGGGDGDGEAEEKARMPAHVVTLKMGSPDSKADAVSEIRAVLPMHYYAARVLVALTNVITAKQIRGASPTESGADETMAMEDMMNDRSSRAVKDAVLSSIGVKLLVRSVDQRGAMLGIFLEVTGERGMLDRAVIYDVDGRPYPTFVMAGWGGRDTVNLQVIGKPKPPLSMGLVLKAAQKTLELPLVVENVALEP